MLLLMKLIHVLGFSVGVGGGAAGMVVGIRAASATAEAKAALAGVQRTIGRMAFAAIVLLWLTGLYLLYAVHGGWTDLPPLFWVKFAFVLVLTAAAIAQQWLGLRVRTGQGAPSARLRAGLGMAGSTAAVLAVIFAVYAFN